MQVRVLPGMRATDVIGKHASLRNWLLSVRIRGRLPIHARVMQLADILSSNLSSSPFESEREYQWRGVLIGKALRLKI